MRAYINNIPYELDANYQIKEQAANKTVSDIVVYVKDNPIPQSGDILEIKDDYNTYFLGVCGIPKSPKYISEFDVKKYSISCINANGILARRLVNVAYKGFTITQIVHALFDKYVKFEGFELGEISDIPIKLAKYTAGDYNLQFCLDELAQLVNGSWYCSNDRKFYFLAKDDFVVMPYVVNSNLIPLTDLQVVVKDTDLRTSQIISGASSTTQEQTESYTYDGKVNDFNVVFPISETPKIYINNIEVSREVIGVKGFNSDDNKMFLYAYNSPIVTYNQFYKGETPPLLVIGDVVKVKYIGYFPIRIVSQNASEITAIHNKTGTSGIIDNVKLDKQIKDINDAIKVGQSLLDNYGKSRTEISGWIGTSKVKELGLKLSDYNLLTKWHFDLPQFGLVGDYVITERTIKQMVFDCGQNSLKISVKFVDRDFIRSYGEVFNELSKAINQLSIRENEIIVDVENQSEIATISEVVKYTNNELDTDREERTEMSESCNIEQDTDFVPVWCTDDADFLIGGQLLSPLGLSLEMFSNGG